MTSLTPAAPADAEPRPAAITTRRLLTTGAAAGPLYVLVAGAQAVARDGFDPRHHAVSLLANGDWGWIQVVNFLVTGLLTIAGAVGIARALPAPGERWAPRLLVVYGASLLAAGVFTADPAAGFPAGTPDGPPATVSGQGIAHFLAGGVGFAAFIAACLVLARRFARQGQRGWAVASAGTGVVFLAAFAGIASGGGAPALNIAFAVAVVLAWTWFTALALHLRPGPHPRRSAAHAGPGHEGPRAVQGPRPPVSGAGGRAPRGTPRA